MDIYTFNDETFIFLLKGILLTLNTTKIMQIAFYSEDCNIKKEQVIRFAKRIQKEKLATGEIN